MSQRRQIANTIVINIIDEPISVIAQYAPNDNPSAGQIHDTWQNGDLYMRTKSTEDGATWSAWHKIVGENGDETNYTFNISSDKTSASATTAPSNCYYNTWQDAPIVTTQQYPYLWMKVVKKEWNASTQTYVNGTPSYVRVTGEESTDYFIEGALNSIRLKAGETNTDVRCTYTFKQKSAVSSTSTTVSCYYAIYLRSGVVFSLLTMERGYSNHGNGTSCELRANVPYNTGSIVHDAVVIYTFATAYYSTSPESQSYMAKKEIPIIKDGDNSFMVDLDNEMTGVIVNQEGKTKAAVSLSPEVRAFYGTQNVISNCTVTASSSSANVTAAYNSTTHCVDISIANNVTLPDTTTITITVVHSSYGTRSVPFIITAAREGTDASIQELLPSPNEISFSRLADKTLSPASRDLTLSIKKTKGDTTTEQTIAQSGLTIRWSTADMPASSSGGTAWGSGTSVTGITWSSNTMQIANSVAVSNIYIAAFNSSGTLVDRETIPIIKDGQHGDDGEDAPSASADPDKISVPCNSNGRVKSEQTTNVTFSLKVGDNAATVTAVSCTAYPTNVVINTISTAVKSITVPTTQTESGISSGCTFIVTGTYNNKSYSAQVTVALIGATQGENPFIVDLDNEMNSIIVDESGNTESAITFGPELRAYYGTQNVIVDCRITITCDNNNVTANYNNTTHRIDISIPASTALSDTTTVTASVNHPSYGTREAYFIIAAIRKGTDAFIQELLPSRNEISFARTASGGLDPASRSIALSIKKTEGGTATIQTVTQSGLTVRWSTTSIPTTKTGGTAWGSGTSVTGITWSNGNMQVANSVEVSNIYIAAFNSGGTLVDRETIPVIKDGEHGDDAPAAFATPGEITIQCDPSGNVKAQTSVDVTFSLVAGGNNITVSGVSYPSTLPTGVSVISRYTNVYTITVGTTATASGIANGITFTVTGTANGTTYSAKVTLALIGSMSGQQGKMGRFYYYAGVFDVTDNTTEFTVNDSQVPFFSYNNEYWLYNPENTPTGGTATMAQMGTPSSTSTSWKIMESSFKYLITEAVFSDFAHLGSAIINDEFMMSQLGYIRGFNGFYQDISSDDNYYLNFNPNEPLGTEELRDYNESNQNQWIVNNGTEREITSSDWSRVGSYLFNLRAGRWYTFEVDGYCDNSGTLQVKLAANANDTAVALLEISGYTNDLTFFPKYITFKVESAVSGCKIFAKKSSGSNAAEQGLYLRFAQFVPHFVVNLHNGEMAANKLNGKLRAKNLTYEATNSLSANTNIVVENQSFISLTEQASGTIILPNPSVAEGRMIEVYSSSYNWNIMWNGARPSDYFKKANHSSNGQFSSWIKADGSGSSLENHTTYLKLWCDGTIWWVLDLNYGE